MSSFTPLFITRPHRDALQSQQAFAKHGIIARLAPLMVIEGQHPPKPKTKIAWDNIKALIFTSANGARFFPHTTNAARQLPVYAIGDATARAAQAQGFTHIKTAEGTSESLIKLICQHEKNCTLYHGAGKHLTGDIKKTLEQKGFNVIRQTLYHAKEVAQLPPTLKEALGGDTKCLLTFYSPRTAELFKTLLIKEGVKTRPSHGFLCLSGAVARLLRDMEGHIHIATHPTHDAMIKLAKNILRCNATP